MRKLAIVSYPVLEELDRQWIESVRLQCDPLASRIRAHFTLVFPFESEPEAVGPHMAALAASAHEIKFVIDGAAAVRDVLGSGAHMFLVAGQGRDQIVDLHDRLYTGVLRPHLRMDIPFLPHLTIAAADLASCETLARELDGRARGVRGSLEHIDLVDVSLPVMQTIARLELGSA